MKLLQHLHGGIFLCKEPVVSVMFAMLVLEFVIRGLVQRTSQCNIILEHGNDTGKKN
jgi:hypothetical protein